MTDKETPRRWLSARRMFKKYDGLIFNPAVWEEKESADRAREYAKMFFDDIVDEAFSKTKSRKSNSYKELYDILLEQDDKWRQVIAYALEKYEWCPLKPDTVIRLAKKVIPQLAMIQKGDFR